MSLVILFSKDDGSKKVVENPKGMGNMGPLMLPKLYGPNHKIKKIEFSNGTAHVTVVDEDGNERTYTHDKP